MPPYSAFLFDLDGTLLDTLTDLTDAVNYSLKTNGFPTRSRAEIRRFLGNGVERLLADAVPMGVTDTTNVVLTFRLYYVEHCMDNTAPYDGIMTALHQLKQQGKKIYIISNKPDEAVQELYHRFFIDYADYAVGESKGIRRKPNPDALWAAARHAGLGREECVYIGDSEVDIEAARRAGMDCISVTWGFRDRDFLLKAGATKLIDLPEQLVDG